MSIWDGLESVFVIDTLAKVFVEESDKVKTADGRLDVRDLAFAVLHRLGFRDPAPVVLKLFTTALERAVEKESHGHGFDARDVAARLLRESKR